MVASPKSARQWEGYSLTANWCRIGVTIGVKTVVIIIIIIIIIPGQSLDYAVLVFVLLYIANNKM